MLRYRGANVSEIEFLQEIDETQVPDVINDDYLASLHIKTDAFDIRFSEEVDKKQNCDAPQNKIVIFISFQPVDKIIKTNKTQNVEYFSVEDLLINIAAHSFVPRHEIVYNQQQVLKQLMVEPHNLPKLLVSDPMARYIGAQTGQLVKIIRNSKNIGEHIVYRLVL